MELSETGIAGCYQLLLKVHRDERGSFVKTFQASEFARLGLATDYREEFFSVSTKGVIRGLHFQVPPQEQIKIVTCVRGQIQDVILDLRSGSPTFLRWVAVPLSGDSGLAMYVPAGCAHGFLVQSEMAIVCYRVTSEYSAAHDGGVRWDSARIEWGDVIPIVSPRDRALPTLAEYRTPFLYRGERHGS